jgi:small subunit ribosomal protein S1
MANDNEQDFGAMLAQFEAEGAAAARRPAREGEVVRGRVVSLSKDAAFVDLGGKSDGMIDLAELRDSDGNLTVAVGDELEATVVEASGERGCVVLRRKLGRGADGRAAILEAHQHGIPVEGVVTAINKGGVEVQVAGVRGFCPISQLELRRVEDTAGYVGQRLAFRVTRCEEEPRGLNLVLSRRALLEEEAAGKAQETRERLAVGAVLRGKVTTLKDYGAFVDLGGLEGLLHVSELGFQRVTHPKDVLTVGQELDVQILKIEKSDDPKHPQRISLSLKALEEDPWQEVEARFPEGARARGTVVRLEPFGAFVEIAPGVEGLVHVGELAPNKRIKHPRDVVKIGQAIEVTVLTVDGARRRIALAPAGERDEEGAMAQAQPAARFGTLGDLLKKKP